MPRAAGPVERLGCPHLSNRHWLFGRIVVFREVNAWRFFGRVWIDWTHTELHAFDPQEEDPKLAPQFLEADVIAMGFARARGNCHHSWELRAEILKERYGIRWRSPREMNPDTMFD